MQFPDPRSHSTNDQKEQKFLFVMALPGKSAPVAQIARRRCGVILRVCMPFPEVDPRPLGSVPGAVDASLRGAAGAVEGETAASVVPGRCGGFVDNDVSGALDQTSEENSSTFEGVWVDLAVAEQGRLCTGAKLDSSTARSR